MHILQVISYDSLRGGISLVTLKGDTTISCLIIQKAQLSDSGKYSCSPSNTDVASIQVHVLNGEYKMQGNRYFKVKSRKI